MKGLEGPYLSRQGERDARATERSGRIMDPNDYNRKLAKILSQNPTMSVEDAMKSLRTHYRLETEIGEQGIGTPRQVRRRDAQTMAALQAAEKNVPNLPNPEARRAFEIAQHQSGAKPLSRLNRLTRGIASFVNDPTELLMARVAPNLRFGPAMVAGVAGGLAGDYIVKPAAEKAGVFNAVGEVSKAAFERMTPTELDIADKALGVSHYILSGGPVSDTVDAVADAISASNKKQAEREVNRAKTGNLGLRPGPKF